MTETKRAVIVGAGSAGLVSAKELLDAGISDITILEREEDLGGVWRSYCWSSATLTSSKWMTEFGSYPMPDEYADFLKPEEMMDYLRSLVKTMGIEDRIHCGVEVQGISRNNEGKYDITTNKGTYNGYDFAVVASGLLGEPELPDVPGIETFGGFVMHGNDYKQPDEFRDKRVLSIALGESGIGISAEISSVAAKTIVSSTTFNPAPRVQPYTTLPFDQMQFWPVGRLMKDYQELLTFEMSWITRLPEPFRSMYVRFHPWLRHYPKEWLPKAFIPYYWVGKVWPKPNSNFGEVSGNLTRPENSTDDILYLVYSGQITGKGRVVRFDETSAYFEDGSQEEIDAVVANTGYKPTVLSMKLPNNWQYRHQELYKGCFHPQMPNLAFVGFVRPTVGSIPAMAEMQARLMAGVFSGQLQLPEPEKLQKIIEKESREHARKCPHMQKRLPHIYFFDQWMEEMAQLIGCQPKLWYHLGSCQRLQAYFFGAPQPLRFRLRGPGAVEDGYERYAYRVDKIFGKLPAANARYYLIWAVLHPHLLTLGLGTVLYWGLDLSAAVSIGVAALFWTLYMSVDLFRFVFSFPLTLVLISVLEDIGPTSKVEQKTLSFLMGGGKPVNYQSPQVFETNASS